MQLSAVLLAAGLSRRMGAQNKLLLPLDGVPLIQHCAQTLLSCRPVEAVAVLGHEAVAVQQALAGAIQQGLRVTHNGHYAEGQRTSVRAGLAALTAPSDGVMICLGDQPWLQPSDLLALAQAFSKRGERSIVVPWWNGRRGNPVVLDWPSVRATLERGESYACRRYIEEHPARVLRWAAPSDAFVRDVDTPRDREELPQVD